MTILNFFVKKTAKTLIIAAILGMVFGIAGCNTMRGIGQDIEKAGEAIQKSSN
jgi:predicted small secreted protein